MILFVYEMENIKMLKKDSLLYKMNSIEMMIVTFFGKFTHILWIESQGNLLKIK